MFARAVMGKNFAPFDGRVATVFRVAYLFSVDFREEFEWRRLKKVRIWTRV